MCGICGYTGDVDGPVLESMIQTLVHRGPDDEGLWRGKGVAFAMRRLAIIDLTTGQQPVFNEDRNIVAIFNGEIYNHIELRSKLEAAGHRFRSHHADSEVITHLYEQYGDKFPNYLTGMFAIALWDIKKRRMLLVRDHVGIKPLYFAHINGNIIFGSEPKALLQHPAVSRTPNLVALHHYFSFKNIPAPFSAFINMEQLRAGEMLIYQHDKITRQTWWQIPYKEEIKISEKEAATHIRELLEESVRLQMRADVPFAAYLSGGVDSSAIVALMSRFTEQPIKTFTLVYEDNFTNKTADQEFALKVAKMYGTEHHEHLVTSKDIPPHIDTILSCFDEPFSGVISTFFITQAIAKHVKVALSGDGADELFGSYLPHRLAQPLTFMAKNRHRLDQLSAEEKQQLLPFQDQTEWLSSILDRGDEALRRMGQYICDDAGKDLLYTPRMQKAVNNFRSVDLIDHELAGCKTTDPLNRMLYLDDQTLLPDQVLAFVDRLSMAHSVEVRPPFLDHRLVAFAASLPGSMKIRHGRVKHILKEAVGDLLPQGLTDRPKEGFIMPINEWIIHNLKPYVEATLTPKRLQRHGILRPEAVAELLGKHYSGKANFGNRIWNIMMFQLWWDRYIEAQGTA